MHNVDTNKRHEEKAKWKLHKNAAHYLEQILEETPRKTSAVRPPASHLTNHSSQMKKTCEALLKKFG